MKKHDDHTKQSEELKKHAEEWKSKYLRALADYQNLEKRTHSEKEETRRFAIKVFLERLLPVIDTLERASKHINDQGLTLALKEFEAALSEFGVTKIETVGRVFDPHKMECIEVVPVDDEKQDNVVLEETLRGYTHNEKKLLRPAQVKVGKEKIN